jgi:23S rRNA (guanosine2251-2'-O)-methyltransferase
MTMAGNSQRKGALRKDGTKKGATVGSGGQRRRALEGKGPTPKAQDRPGHPAERRARRADRPAPRGGGRDDRSRSGGGSGDVVAGRNAVLEALQAAVPATALYLLDTIEADDRTRAAVALANKRGLPVQVTTRIDLDRIARTGQHQGLALATSGFQYVAVEDLPAAAVSPVLVALDHITDPHNLGAIARSALAFGAGGILVPQRRSAPVTAGAWKASAGALARLPVARVGNLASTLSELQRDGFFVLGLEGGGTETVDSLSEALVRGPLVLVVGSEGEGLARLTAKVCDLLVSIPMPGSMESLNASVAAGIALHDLARRRA